jgi:2-polyprenyl-6-methoxyphenol hydroxylase-like FAD-dependent oxidoreductase
VTTPRGVASKRQAARTSEWHGSTPTSRGGARYGILFSGSRVYGLAPATRLPDRSALGAEANVTLIGDAAHVMPPYAGEGVNMAMLDALVLSRLLLSQDTSSDAIAAYEAEMFARMRHMTEDTMVNTEMFYAPDASDRVVALFRSFGAAEAVPPAAEA